MPVKKETGISTSLYLDTDSRTKLTAMADASGDSRSVVVRNLIQKAGSGNKVKMRKLVNQLAEALDAT